MRLLCVAAALSLLAVSAAPAAADIDEQDRQFLSTMESIGWNIYDPQRLISEAHMVCNEGLGHGVSWPKIRAGLMGWGYSVFDASLLIANAVDIYCPEHAEITDQIVADPSFRRSGPGQ